MIFMRLKGEMIPLNGDNLYDPESYLTLPASTYLRLYIPFNTPNGQGDCHN
jgi:hypothetical protein